MIQMLKYIHDFFRIFRSNCEGEKNLLFLMSFARCNFFFAPRGGVNSYRFRARLAKEALKITLVHKKNTKH